MRTGSVERNTKETKIKVSVNLDGTGEYSVSTGVGLAVDYAFPGSLAGTAVLLALYLAIGWMGNDLIRRNLEAQGFEDKGPVRAQDEDEALYRYLDADPVLARDLAGAGFRA